MNLPVKSSTSTTALMSVSGSITVTGKTEESPIGFPVSYFISLPKPTTIVSLFALCSTMNHYFWCFSCPSRSFIRAQNEKASRLVTSLYSFRVSERVKSGNQRVALDARGNSSLLTPFILTKYLPARPVPPTSKSQSRASCRKLTVISPSMISRSSSL